MEKKKDLFVSVICGAIIHLWPAAVSLVIGPGSQYPWFETRSSASADTCEITADPKQSRCWNHSRSGLTSLNSHFNLCDLTVRPRAFWDVWGEGWSSDENIDILNGRLITPAWGSHITSSTVRLFLEWLQFFDFISAAFYLPLTWIHFWKIKVDKVKSGVCKALDHEPPPAHRRTWGTYGVPWVLSNLSAAHRGHTAAAKKKREIERMGTL